MLNNCARCSSKIWMDQNQIILTLFEIFLHSCQFNLVKRLKIGIKKEIQFFCIDFNFFLSMVLECVIFIVENLPKGKAEEIKRIKQTIWLFIFAFRQLSLWLYLKLWRTFEFYSSLTDIVNNTKLGLLLLISSFPYLIRTLCFLPSLLKMPP